MTLVPIITSQYSATYRISKYLDQLLRPFAIQTMRSVIFQDPIEMMQKLYAYVHSEHRLTSTTMFCTIEIINSLTLLPHDTMIDVICNFVYKNTANNRLYNIPIPTIKNLLQLCLYNNMFCYKNKIYKFLRGGPTTSPLMYTLANIYLFSWQQNIIDKVQQNKELFGRYYSRFALLWESSYESLPLSISFRYQNRIFFTWNGFANELEDFLHTLDQMYPFIRFRADINTHVSFMNVDVANEAGRLRTRVYHDPTIQPYTLPYVVGHSKVNYSDYIRTALLQAACYCSSAEDFQRERIYIELCCLANGYSYYFVDSRVKHFFEYFQVDTYRYTMYQLHYDKFRRQCFEFADMQRTRTNALQKFSDNSHFIRLYYLYEFGARCEFNQEFIKRWHAYFGSNPILCKEKTAIQLSSKHRHTLNTLLCEQKSSCGITI